MSSHVSHVERFVRGVHRRVGLLRFVGRGGLGELAGGRVGVAVLAGVGWGGGGGGWGGLVVGVVGGGVGRGRCAGGGVGGGGWWGGGLWGSARRPGRLWAAIEADRQLKLADLLGTALYLIRSRDSLDGIGRSVVAAAEARCAS